MAVAAIKTVKVGASLLCAGALVGAVVSIANFLSPDSGIAGTPGAILVIVSTVILLSFGLIMRADRMRSRGWRIFIAASALFDIVGTAFAGHLLNSQVLVAMMMVALAGWLLNWFDSRSVQA